MSDEDDDETLPRPAGTHVEQLAPDLALLSFPLPEPVCPEALTTAEQDIALAVYAGASNEDIARSRGVSDATVKNQLDRIYRKLGVSSRVELVLRLRGASA